MHKTVRTTLFILIFAVLTLGYTDTSLAQDTATIQSTRIEGEILRIDDHRVILETKNNQIKELTVPTGVKIERDERESEYKNLQPGDRVILIQNNNGEVISVESTSAPIVNLENIILPILLLLVPLTILALILKMKSQRNFIRTSGISV